MTADELNPLISTTTRLSVMAVLAAATELEFSAARDASGVSDSVLSKQVGALEAAGYVRVRKGHVGPRRRTWLSLTKAGRKALRSHIGALQRLVRLATGENREDG